MWSKAFLVALLTAVAVGAADSVSEDGQETKAKKKVMRREVSSMLQSQNENDVLQSQEVTTLAAAAAKLSNEQFSLLQDILDKQVEEREVLSHSKDDVTMTSKGDITHEEELVDANVHADSAGVMEVSGSGGLLDHKTVDSLESDEGSAVEDEGRANQSRWSWSCTHGPRRRRCRDNVGDETQGRQCENDAQVTRRNFRHECNSRDMYLLPRTTSLDECAAKVRQKRGEKGWSPFFIFGIRSKQGACYWEYGIQKKRTWNGETWNNACDNRYGFQYDSYNFYQLDESMGESRGTGNYRRRPVSGNAAGRR